MVSDGRGVIYASSAQPIPEHVDAVLRAISPNYSHVGELGDGMRMKYVANLLVMVHLAATAEAMALATRFGLDLDMVVELISRSPAAASGQFAVRAPLVAASRFEGKLVDIRDTREVATQVAEAAQQVGASAPLVTLARELFNAAGARGHDDQDPAKLAVLLAEGSIDIGPMPSPGE
jgi:3-hydroxyisobutyrate dehydrogenase-like beta-hydroxyacid dehydrogenase